jgi:hypothetical protein
LRNISGNPGRRSYTYPVADEGLPVAAQLLRVQAIAPASAPGSEFRLHGIRPRPVLELYDPGGDPGELNNLAGRREDAGVQRIPSATLPEKLITDSDFVPPVLLERGSAAAGAGRKR